MCHALPTGGTDTLGLLGALDGFAMMALFPMKVNILISAPLGYLTSKWHHYLSQYFLSHENSLLLI